MPSTMKRLRSIGKHSQNITRAQRTASAASAIRRMGDEWARHWNAGDLDGVAGVYAEDAVYLPPHHEAVHGREAIREYLKAPLSHGVTDLAFDVTYIKQRDPIAWDVGTYRMTVPQSDETKREDHGKYLTVWRRTGEIWLIAADAWSSDLPTSV
jgi:uncharacterized protein (TIGR02246 family)